MGDASKIQWTGATWNCWQGCHKVSDGCKYCYMFRDMERYGQDPNVVVRSKPATFDKPLRWQREAERGDRVGAGRLVFTCSWSDWFIAEADPWRDDAWAIVRACPLLSFQVLTKRIDRAKDHLPADWGGGYHGVWLGTSVESQAYADARIPHLLRTPAAVRFLSVEPLLGPVDLTAIPRTQAEGFLRPLDGRFRTIDWVIVGGESGPGARPMHPDWARSIRDQCVAAGVPFFFKQWGQWAPVGTPKVHARVLLEASGASSPYDPPPGVARHPRAGLVTMYRVGKKAAGRLLDGQEWSQFPTPAETAHAQ